MKKSPWSKRPLVPPTLVLAGTICVVQLIAISTVAQTQERPMFVPGGVTVLAQRTDQTDKRSGTPITQKGLLSWKDILNKEQQSPPGSPQTRFLSPVAWGKATMGGGMPVTGPSGSYLNRFFAHDGHGPGYTRVGDRREDSNNSPTDFDKRFGQWRSAPFVGPEQVRRVPEGGVVVEDETVGVR
jgi:hypothetical protein